MAFFFATANDLLPVLLNVEAKHAVVYTPCGHIHVPKAEHCRTARELPTLFRSQPFESAVNGPTYLVTEANTNVVLRELAPFGGRNRWAIDQLANPESTILRHGGMFKRNVLLQGEIRTVQKTAAAQRLQRAFDASIRKHFVKIKAFYVGSEAEVLLDSGCRLTAAEQCPSEYDLCR